MSAARVQFGGFDGPGRTSAGQITHASFWRVAGTIVRVPGGRYSEYSLSADESFETHSLRPRPIVSSGKVAIAGAEPRLALSHVSPLGPLKPAGSVMPPPVEAHVMCAVSGRRTQRTRSGEEACAQTWPEP